MNPSDLNDTLVSLRSSLELLGRWGCRGFDCSPRSMAILEGWWRPQADAKPPGATQASHPQAQTLDQVRLHMGECRSCGLSAQRTHIVFGEGNPEADLVFVGEAPGLDEDRSGRPFVGAAGQLLTRIIESMKLSRQQVYICNVIKCRPPGNRNPEKGEIDACRPFLQNQLTAIHPKVICALGTFAAQTLLDSTQPISRLRGRFHDFSGIKVMPTFHPSYLLRNEERKREVWEDMKKIMVLLRIPL
jgi:uracil-DNA glycosylase